VGAAAGAGEEVVRASVSRVFTAGCPGVRLGLSGVGTSAGAGEGVARAADANEKAMSGAMRKARK